MRQLWPLLALLSLLMTACQQQGSDDLQHWMAEIRQRHHVKPVSLPQVPQIPEFRYQAGERADPFDLSKLSTIDPAALANTPQPDLRRSREPLETFPLDSLRLIGNLRRGKEVVALIQADKLIHTVRVGAHLGQDLGKVVAISDKTVDIDEWVAEGSGRWLRRQTQLVLQEKK
jgi:type IV pilus assembly protein PilP